MSQNKEIADLNNVLSENEEGEDNSYSQGSSENKYPNVKKREKKKMRKWLLDVLFEKISRIKNF